LRRNTRTTVWEFNLLQLSYFNHTLMASGFQTLNYLHKSLSRRQMSHITMFLNLTGPTQLILLSTGGDTSFAATWRSRIKS